MTSVSGSKTSQKILKFDLNYQEDDDFLTEMNV